MWYQRRLPSTIDGHTQQSTNEYERGEHGGSIDVSGVVVGVVQRLQIDAARSAILIVNIIIICCLGGENGRKCMILD